jgi:hypothetical protein
MKSLLEKLGGSKNETQKEKTEHDEKSEIQKTEIIHEIRKVIPSCPVKVVKND